MSRQHYGAAELDQPFQIARQVETPDGAGGYSTAETLLPSPTTYHLAKVRPLRGQERLANEQIGAYGECLFVVHRDLGILETDVLVYAGRRYNVTLVNPPGRSAYVEIEATRGGATP